MYLPDGPSSTMLARPADAGRALCITAPSEPMQAAGPVRAIAVMMRAAPEERAHEGPPVPPEAAQAGNQPDDKDETQHVRTSCSGPARIRAGLCRRGWSRYEKRLAPWPLSQRKSCHFICSGPLSQTADGRKPAGHPAFGYSLAREYPITPRPGCQRADCVQMMSKTTAQSSTVAVHRNRKDGKRREKEEG